jgi:SAM-dependent methyltransferase
MNRDAWNARYAEAEHVEHVWGAEPNRFVADELAGLPPGRALDLGCGGGRNALWLAERGWTVEAVDFSDVAIERARSVALERGVDVAYRVGDVLRVPIEPAAWDLVLVAYLQLPEEERAHLLDRAADAVAPGGRFLLVAHDLRNLHEGHGGPSEPSVLWTVTEVVDALATRGFEIERAEEVLRDVDGAPRPAIDTLVRARRYAASAAA